MDSLLTDLKSLGLIVLILVGLPIVVIGGISLCVIVGDAVAKRFPRRRRAGQNAGEFRVVRSRLNRLARPTWLLTPTQARGFSKLGGDPDLPLAIDWPDGAKSPRAFLAQIDLAEAQARGALDWLPAEGRLYFFWDDWRAGFADEVRVVHSLDAAGEPRSPPPGLAVKQRFGERRAAFLSMTSIPSLDWLGVDYGDLDVSEDELDQLAEMPHEPFGDELQHRIGGYPCEIQGVCMPLECEHLARGLKYDYEAEIPPAIARASKSWRLLLQIDTDPALKMQWGDGGRLYVFVRAQHARAGDFSKTVTISQCY